MKLDMKTQKAARPLKAGGCVDPEILLRVCGLPGKVQEKGLLSLFRNAPDKYHFK